MTQTNILKIKLLSVRRHYKTNLYKKIITIVDGRLREFHTGIWQSTPVISTCMLGVIVQQIDSTAREHSWMGLQISRVMIRGGDIAQLYVWADHRFLTSNMYVKACKLLL